MQSTSMVVVLALTLSLMVAGLIVSPVGLLSPIADFSVPLKAQGIQGNVTFLPVSPSCGLGTKPDPIVYFLMQEEILISPRGGSPLTFPMHWTVDCVRLVGTFRIGLDPGIYYVDLVNGAHQSECSGYCAVLPANVTVVAGNFTEISILFRTSIR